MSVWSYVSGVIEVDTFADSDAEAMFLAQTVIDHLPKIDGSEHCAKFYLNKIQGYETSSNVDEFRQRSNLRRGGHYLGLFKWQTRILITINGSLRDADFEHALKDTTRMLARLSSRLSVMSCLVSVLSEGRQFIFNNPDWILNRKDTGWADKLRINWRDYLLRAINNEV